MLAEAWRSPPARGWTTSFSAWIFLVACSYYECSYWRGGFNLFHCKPFFMLNSWHICARLTCLRHKPVFGVSHYKSGCNQKKQVALTFSLVDTQHIALSNHHPLPASNQELLQENLYLPITTHNSSHILTPEDNFNSICDVSGMCREWITQTQDWNVINPASDPNYRLTARLRCWPDSY